MSQTVRLMTDGSLGTVGQPTEVPLGTTANPIITQAVIGGAASGTKLEDSAAADGDAGSASLWVRRDTNTTWTNADNDYTNPAVDKYGNVKDSPTPTDLALAAVTQIATAAAAGSLVVKASAGNLYDFNVVAGASAGFVMIFNAVSAPADGAVTPAFVIPLAANAGVAFSFPYPRRFSTGITIVFSTTGPFSKTISATAFISAGFM
jgi:hypothetical protein